MERPPLVKVINKIDRALHPRQVYVHPNYRYLTDFIKTLPEQFRNDKGTVIFKRRNELRKFKKDGIELVVKSFRIPNIINQIVYGLFRASKAKRSYMNAERLIGLGVGSPQPIGYLEVHNGLLFWESYYISCLSTCPYVYEDLFYHQFDYADEVLRAIGKTTALLHENGYAHKDYGRRNILFGKMPDGTLKIEIVDLNRMYTGTLNMKQGCKNFERLPATPHMHHIMAEEYAKARGFDTEKCYELMAFYRKDQPDKIDNLY